DGERYEDEVCRVIVPALDENRILMFGDAESNPADKPTNNGSMADVGVWKVSGNDFTFNQWADMGASYLDNPYTLSDDGIAYHFSNSNQVFVTLDLNYYFWGMSNLKYDLNITNCGNSGVRILWDPNDADNHRAVFQSAGNYSGQSISMDPSYFYEVAGVVCTYGGQLEATITNIRLELIRCAVNVVDVTQKYYLRQYSVDNDSRQIVEDESKRKDITPAFSLDSVSSYVGGSASGVYRGDVLNFRLDNFDSTYLNFNGIEVSTDGQNYTKYTDGLSIKIDENFYNNFNTNSNTNLYFRPVLEQKASTVKFTLENSNKGTYTNLDENYTVNINKGDSISNIVGKSGSVSAYQPSFSYRSGSSDTQLPIAYTPSSNDGYLTLDTSNSQGAIAIFIAPDSYAEVMLAYANPRVTVMANPNRYLHTYNNEVITIDGKAYNCSVSDDLEALHEAVNAKIANGEDIEAQISFDYYKNPNYKGADDTDQFGTPKSATLNVFDGDGVQKSTDTVNASPSTKDNETVYTFTFDYKISSKGNDWLSDSTATVIIYGTGTRTSEETPICFIGSDDTFSVVYVADTDSNIITDANGKQYGSLLDVLTYEDVKPLDLYKYTALPANGFLTRWFDFSLDSNNDGNIDPDERNAAEQRLADLGKDPSILNNYNPVSYTGNIFTTISNIFANTKYYYNYFKRDTAVSNKNLIALSIYEKRKTVIDPDNYMMLHTYDDDGNNISSYYPPLVGATVTFAGELAGEVGPGVYQDTGDYSEDNNYIADIVYHGVHYQASATGCVTKTITVDTSAIMYPVNFNVSAKENGEVSDTGVKSGGGNNYLEYKDGVSHIFQFDFQSSIGVIPNKARLALYNSEGDEYFSTEIERSDDNLFRVEIDLNKAGLKSGSSLKIQGIYNDGDEEYVYPEVDSGIIFTHALTVLTVATSFKTALLKPLKMFGSISTQFDLPLDFDLKNLGTQSQYTDKNGDMHQTTQIAFGYNTEVLDALKKIQKEAQENNDGSAMSGRDSVLQYVNEIFDNASDDKKDDEGGDEDKGKDADQNEVSDSAKKAQDGNTEKSDMNNKSFNFSFSVAVILNIETGPSSDPLSSGNKYFDSLMLVCSAEASGGYSVIYTTPIGIDLMLSLNVSGTAAAIFAVTPSKDASYTDMFDLTKDGDEKSFTFSKNDFSIYTKFFISPTIVIETGVGIGGGKIAKLTVTGTAAFNFQFTKPILGSDTGSEGSGSVDLSADLTLKILFIKKSWNLYKNENINLFNYGTNSVSDMLSDFKDNYLNDTIKDDDLQTVSRDYLSKSSKWQPTAGMATEVREGAEILLKKGVYPYPDSKITDLGDGVLIAVFLDDPGENVKDIANCTTVMYSISNDDGKHWSEPKAADSDKTRDEAPYVYKITDKKALIVWSDAVTELSSDTTGKALKDNLSALDICGAWVDIEKAKNGGDDAVGEHFNIVQTEINGRTDFQETAPMVSFDEKTGKLLVYFTVTDYDDGANSDPEKVTFGEIINGYSAIGVVSADIKDDGRFGEFSAPSFVNLAIPATIKQDGKTVSLTGGAITDPKVI
ncbi:MAG: hypothetical protein IJS94_07500, partial [Clostridia bacterium]|nr:hypothetical protein [Clostridia bacterium]